MKKSTSIFFILYLLLTSCLKKNTTRLSDEDKNLCPYAMNDTIRLRTVDTSFNLVVLTDHVLSNSEGGMFPSWTELREIELFEPTNYSNKIILHFEAEPDNRLAANFTFQFNNSLGNFDFNPFVLNPDSVHYNIQFIGDSIFNKKNHNKVYALTNYELDTLFYNTSDGLIQLSTEKETYFFELRK